MAVTNLLKQQVDQPVFEWMRPAPTATSATSVLAASDDLNSRYMYYLVASTLWRYDTYGDSWQELATCPTAPLTFATMKFAKFSGNRGHVISATSTTLEISGLGKFCKLYDNLKIRIISGKGAGQERTITNINDSVIHDFGNITSASQTSIIDSNKKWRFNQWDGYQVRVLSGAALSPYIRKVLYNNQTTLTLSDTNYQAIDPFNNTQLPVALNATGTTTSAYLIESTVVDINTPWDVIPDKSSIYQIISGGLWFFSSQTIAPFSSFQFYDILSDSWFTRTPIGGQLNVAFDTDCAMDRIGEVAGSFITGLTATSGFTRGIIDAGATYDIDRYSNHQIRIISGTGIGQRRRIIGHGATAIYIEKDWAIVPDNTSKYEIYGDTDKIWLVGSNSSTLWQYSIESDLWANGHISDYGIARNISATPYAGVSYESPHQGFGITSIVRTTSGILSGTVNAAGTNYVVGDLVTCSTSGTNGQFYVTAVGSGGAVTSLQLAASGSGYANGSSNTTGGAGSGLTITLTVGTTALVTTALNHDLLHDEQIKISGCATDTSFNSTFSTIGVGSQTTFSIAAPSSTTNPTAANTQSTTLLVDAEKTWLVNEHVGKIIHIQTAGTSPTTQSRRITSNTANTITVPTITTATNGTSRYLIQEIHGFGAMVTNPILTKLPYGWATSGTATTLVDSTKNWNNNQWINCKVRIVSGTGVGNEATITGNTATTLTVASWPVATPDSSSKYEILDSYGVVTTGGSSTTITDANKNWTTNILAGRRGRIIAGTGVGNNFQVTSNTATVITTSTITTDTTSVYEIYENPIRSTGCSLDWAFGMSDTTKKGRWLVSFRGGGSTFVDIYDIPSNTWELSPFIGPNFTSFTTGSMYAYDGHDSIYMSKDSTNRIYVLNLNTLETNAVASIPYAHGTAILGKRMEVIETADGLQYLYIMRHTGQEMWRTLKFW